MQFVFVCLPLGHNCFGAILYPITMADFMVADMTDGMLDGMAWNDTSAADGRGSLFV